MFDPHQLPIHYDRCLGVNPDWRGLIMSSLRGDGEPMLQECALLSSIGARSSASLLYTMREYALYGQTTYCVGPLMRDAFVNANLGAIPVGSFRLPYPAFYVTVPDNPWKVWGRGDTGWHKVGGFYVHQVKNFLSIQIWGVENALSKEPGEDALFWVDLNLDGLEKAYTLDGDVGMVDLGAYLRDVLDPKEGRFTLALDLPRRAFEQQMAVAKEIARLVFCLGFYLASEGGHVEATNLNQDRAKALEKALARKKNKTKGPAKRIARELETLATPRVVWVGPHIEREFESRKRADHKVGAKRPSFHYRAGHFHHYWTGPRIDDEGSPIPRSQQVRVTRWVEGVFVNLDLRPEHDFENDPGTVARLRGDKPKEPK